jgi:hypothetical protein
MAAEPVPPAIVAAVSGLGEALGNWSRSQRTASLDEHEQQVLGLLRQVAGTLLGAVLEEALGLGEPSLERVRSSCPGCGTRRRRQSWRRRELVTVCGVVTIRRPYYYCRPCQRGWCPSDATLSLAPYQEMSVRLRGWMVLLGVLEPSRRAAAVLEELTGLGVGAETIRSHTRAVGETLLAAQERAATQVERTQEPAEAVEPAEGQLIVQTDGLQLRYRDGWHEVKLGLVAGCRVGEPHALVAPSYIAARLSADAFGPRLVAEAARRGALEVVSWEGPPPGTPAALFQPSLAVLREVVVLGDGAPWIWSLAAEHFGRRIDIVDWYHATEHLWTLGKALWGDGTAAAKAWVEQAKTRLWEQGPAALLADWRPLCPSTAEATEVLRRERGYFTTNVSRMHYPRYRAQGLPIGSGAVESAAKHVVQQRLKRAGMRWSFAGAQALLALCAHHASGRPIPRLLRPAA